MNSPGMLARLLQLFQTPPTPSLPASLSQHQSYTTYLPPDQEAQFQSWVKANRIPWQDTPNADYDMRGFWKAQQSGDPNAQRASNLHFPDTYKTPYHRTFSNESIYATPDAPHWQGDVLIDKAGRVVADERPKGSQK